MEELTLFYRGEKRQDGIIKIKKNGSLTGKTAQKIKTERNVEVFQMSE